MEDRIQETKRIFFNLYNDKVIEILPCGNHELKRNLVYHVKLSSEHYVIKFFYKPLKRDREINIIPQTYEFNPLRILYQGELVDGTEWIIYNYIEGWLLDHIIDDLDLDQRRAIFEEVGMKLAQLHSLKTFDYFGDLSSDKQSSCDAYKSFVIDDTERLIKNINMQDLSEIPELKKAIEIIRSEYTNIRCLQKGRYCHRDLDGRNIIIKMDLERGLSLEAFLDFEKTVIYNEYYDIVNLYRRYFLEEPKLIPHFFKGYTSIINIDDSFNKELRFNLYRLGIDICSWSKTLSDKFFEHTIAYLNALIYKDEHLSDYYLKL
ncbi:MAG: hypothetical protein BGO41_07690 [Clostridiales bacterium 38-18]|nr:MAG: hypothetical protein BGO41_07690 [Clostridiales bacterium 38-18]